MISCIMPTYNRYPRLGYLVDEAVECFLRQEPVPGHNLELVIVNDTPGQRLVYGGPNHVAPDRAIKILNIPERLSTLSDKIQVGINAAEGELLCRWDDDDIHLPHRLRYSHTYLGNRLEWRAVNHLYENGALHHTASPGNSHTASLWRREVLTHFPGHVYPQKLSGCEDQAFNRLLQQTGLVATGRAWGQQVPEKDIYYLYRWNTGSAHLSGVVDNANPDNPHQAHWDARGREVVAHGTFAITPRWRRNYVAYVEQWLRRPRVALNPTTIAGYFNYPAFYDWIVTQMGTGARLVEVGTLSGASTCYLANAARATERRMRVFGVDLGIGVDEFNFKRDYTDCHGLIENIWKCGCADMVTPILCESTMAAAIFPDNSLDFVMLDPAHLRNAIRSDLQAWVPKVRRGGYIAGHDYQGTPCPEVAPEVDAYFGVPSLALASPHAPSVWVKRID